MEEFSSTFMTPITHIGPVRVAIVLRVLFCVQVGGQRLSFLPSVYTPGIRWMNWVSVIFQRLEGCLDRMPSFNHEERSMLVDLDGKDTFLVMLPGFAKERRQDPVLFGEANRFFANLDLQSSVPWIALISGNVQKGHSEECIKLFIEMQRAEKTADAATYASILKACANLASQALGKHHQRDNDGGRRDDKGDDTAPTGRQCSGSDSVTGLAGRQRSDGDKLGGRLDGAVKVTRSEVHWGEEEVTFLPSSIFSARVLWVAMSREDEYGGATESARMTLAVAVQGGLTQRKQWQLTRGAVVRGSVVKDK
ncbi:hypothetical protein S83_059866 [Arachis hypogaea]